MAIYRKDAETIEYTAVSDLQAGAVVKLASDFYGVAHCPIESGTVGALQVKGQYDFVANEAVSAFVPVFVDSNGAVGATSAADAYVGLSVTAATSGAEVRVLLNE